MKWEAFECDDCGRRYALEQPDDDEIPEPLCPSCGSGYSKPIEPEIFERVWP
ncbi:Zinc ribbon domain protein [compost metagenome]